MKLSLRRGFAWQNPKKLFTESSIMKEKHDRFLLANWIADTIKTPKFSSNLLWKGTMDGFGELVFHSKCDKKGRTITVVLPEFDHIFSGYTIRHGIPIMVMQIIQKHLYPH
jgi:hypothetical protein